MDDDLCTGEWHHIDLQQEGNVMKEIYPLRLLKELHPYHLNWDLAAASPFECAFEMQRKGMDLDTSVDLAYAGWMLARWKSYQQVYDVDPALAMALGEQAKGADESYKLPAELLLNLPYPALCFKTIPIKYEKSKEEEGFYYTGWMLVSIDDSDENNKSLVVCFERTEGNGRDDPLFRLPIVKDGTIGDSLKELIQDIEKTGIVAEKEIAKAEMQMALFAAQIILYIQSSGADVRRVPRGTKNKRKSSKEKPIKQVNVGYNIGRTLRKSRAIYEYDRKESTGKHTRPHVRRGHFHSYWVGHKDSSDRRLVVKWIAPIFVGGKDQDDVTVTKVK